MEIAVIAAIVGATIGGIFAIIAALISRSRKKEKRPEREPERPPVTGPRPPAEVKPPTPEAIPTPPIPYFAHPYPLQENFTGRLSERKELTEWFSKGTEPMFAYVAIGGMGKSALTWYWLQEDIIKKGLAPEGIIWWSFYDREARFESFLMKAIQYVSKGKIDAEGMASNRDRMETLNTLLSSNRFLLVLDGVERVLRAYAGLGSPYQGDEVKEDERGDFRTCVEPNVGTFLQWLCSGNPKTKTLLTSRLCPRELDDIAGCFHRELKKLNKEDAVDFFRRQGVEKGTRAEIESVCDYFGYHPLSLRLLSGMIAKDAKYMGDVTTWTKHNPLPELKAKKRHILQLAYDSLHEKKRTLISKLSAFRNPMDYDSISIFNQFEIERKFDEVLIEMVDRGLLLRDAESNKYDLHPIVRRYCYGRLLDKKGVHSQLRDHFANVPEPEKVKSLEDLEPVVELYHHTVGSGKYDGAYKLYLDRLSDQLYYDFGAYQKCIELGSALFPKGLDHLPELTDKGSQAYMLTHLANSYALSGQPKKAVPLFERQIAIREKQGVKQSVAIGVGNLAIMAQIPLGELKSAESNLQRRINLSQEIKDEWSGGIGHREVGRLLAYQGRFDESEKELAKALELLINERALQSQGVVWEYRAVRALLVFDAEGALKAAKKARELADVGKVEADTIWAEWLVGAAYLAKGDLKGAEEHLDEALVRDRRINMVDLEPDILLELAKLRFKQGHSVTDRSASGGKEEALKLAKEALGIADRCEYRLKQADIHNFLAEFYLDAKDFAKAKEHVEKAKERAECGYVPAMKKAEELAGRIRQGGFV